jgi:DNA repair exonuclease SbcCD nuclease subunit
VGIKQKPYVLNLAFISDIHLGNPRVPTHDIISRLEKAFPSNAKTGELDILFIGGDLFDQILNLPENQVTEIHLWMYRLLGICKKWDIKLRVLEGTPSHDRGQSALFDTVNTVSKIGADCKYIDRLSIEHMDDLDLDILYIPDEWRHDPDDTWSDVQEALNKAGIDKVDYSIMHGVFEHQLPAHLRIPTHIGSRYLGITRKYISIGHHHTMVVRDRIIAQGSFDRLRHGEEEAKGFFKVTSRDRVKCDNDTLLFVENKEAATFKTINLVGMDEDTIKNRLNEVCLYRQGSHIRVVIDKFSPSMGLVQSYIKAKVEFKWSTVAEGETGSKEIKPVEFDKTKIAVDIGKRDITQVLETRLRTKGHSDKFISKALSLLEAIK